MQLLHAGRVVARYRGNDQVPILCWTCLSRPFGRLAAVLDPRPRGQADQTMTARAPDEPAERPRRRLSTRRPPRCARERSPAPRPLLALPPPAESRPAPPFWWRSSQTCSWNQSEAVRRASSAVYYARDGSRPHHVGSSRKVPWVFLCSGRCTLFSAPPLMTPAMRH